jgi:hypothetical protein
MRCDRAFCASFDRARGEEILLRVGPVDVYPESETRYFDNFGNQWTFVRNEKHEVTAVMLHGANFQDWEGKKVKADQNSP